MRRFILLTLAVLLLVAVFARIPAAKTARLNRDLLWATVQVCAASQRRIGHSIPCRAVDLGAPDRPGTALLRVPRAATHHVLMPTDDFAGLEAPELQGPAGAALFRAAWAARTEIGGDSSARVEVNEIGLAINSAAARSQDHLHIHIDCVGGRARSVLRQAAVGKTWTELPRGIGGQRYLARRYVAEALSTLNPFAAAAEILPDTRLLSQASFAVIPAADGGLFLLVDPGPNGFAERLLDQSCSG